MIKIRLIGMLCVFLFLLTACFSSGSDNNNNAVDTSPPTPPGTPRDTGNYTNSITVRFSWSAASDSESGITRYNIEVGSSPGASDVVSTNAGNNLYYDVSASNGQTLYARVQAVNGAGLTSAWSNSSDGITIDSILPSINITSPTSENTLTDTTIITADASDNVSIDRVEFHIDSNTVIATDITAPYQFELDIAPLSNTTHTIYATAFDEAGNSQTHSINVIINNDITSPIVNITSPLDGDTLNGVVSVSSNATDNVAVARVDFSVDGSPALASDTTSPYAFDLDTNTLSNAIHIITATAFDARNNSHSHTISVTIDNTISTPPPDPATVAPDLDKTVATTMIAATEFLYKGSNILQTGVTDGTIEPVRVAVLRGKINERNGNPIEGVNITILDHDEYGQTLSRSDGLFDMAVNGGGYHTVNYVKEGYLPVQRQIDVPWQDYAWLPDVVMIPVDSTATPLVMNSSTPMQVAQGSVVTDVQGSRQAVLMMPQGTTATINLPGGGTQTINTLTFRATEYTVGDTGPEAMPGELPPASGYTYAVELSADEALTSGIKVNGKDVMFNQPVPFYVDNFLNFPVGGIVPIGYYDNDKGAWVAYDNGIIIEVISEASGLADVDVDGDGVADTGAALSDLNITDAEREQLANLYSPGKSLWRAQLDHLSTWDHNWPYVPPVDAIEPPTPPINNYNKKKKPDDPCQESGSIIECQSQVLGERLVIVGSEFTLNYRSDRVPGNVESRTIEIPLSGSSVPASLVSIQLEVSVAGQVFKQNFPPNPNQTYNFIWNGQDAYGRILKGMRPVTVRIGYTYEGQYQYPQAFGVAFARYSATGTSLAMNQVGGRNLITLWKDWQDTLGSLDVSQLGGWSLDVHHAYDTAGHKLFRGDGSRRSTGNVNTITTVAGNGVHGIFGDGGPAINSQFFAPYKIVFADDGSYYILDSSRVRKVGTDGIITTVAGSTTAGFSGDGGPATSAQLSGPTGIALAPDGSLYIADAFNYRIRKVDADGIINTIAGDGTAGFTGDHGPATVAQFWSTNDIAVAPDGGIYILDSGRVRYVGTDGIISTVIGSTSTGFSGDGGLASDAQLSDAAYGLEVGPDGSIYIADGLNNRIRKVTPDGIINTIAGTGVAGDAGDGGQATSAQLRWPRDIAVGPEGSLYIADSGTNNRIRRIDPNGVINTVAGNGALAYSGDNGPAVLAAMNAPYGLDIAPDGSLYIADTANDRIRRVAPALPGFEATDFSIPSTDGNELYRFNSSGKHLQTLSTLTGTALYNFNYDSDGWLTSIVDADGNTTTIVRDSQGTATAITASSGQNTLLTSNADDYLETITNPAGETTTIGYGSEGLVTSITNPASDSSQYTYNAFGQLTLAEDEATGSKAFSRTTSNTGYTVTQTTAMGRVTTYQMEYLPTGNERSLVTYPNGTQTEVIINTDGSATINSSNGLTSTMQHGPDPRFGMLSPVLQSLSISSPAGLTRNISQVRSVSLSDPDNLLSLQTLQNTVTENGRITTYLYNASTSTYTKTTPEGYVTTSEIDSQARITSLTLATGVDPITFSYDAEGRITQRAQGTQLATYTYDVYDRVSSRMDAASNTTTYGYDNANRLTSMLLANSETISFSYDNKGNRTGVTMPSLDAHGLGYTARDFMGSYTPPDNASFTFNRDQDKALSSKDLPGGRTISNTFNATTGQWTNESYSEAAISMTYPASSNLLDTMVWTPASGTAQNISFSYDGPLVTGQIWSGAAVGDYSYTYDNNFQLIESVLDSGTDSITTSLSYDNDGMAVSFGPFTMTRNGPGGAMTQMADTNSSTGIGYDTSARPQSKIQTVNSSTVYAYSLTRNNLGLISQKVESVGGSSHTYDYSYDEIGQLTSVSRDSVVTESYTYDENGNRLTSPVATYDSQDRTSVVDGVTYQFNSDGFLTDRGSDTLTYSARGELLSVTTGGNTISYSYDGIGRRVSRTDTSGTTEYLYGDPGNPFQLTAIREASGDLFIPYYDDAGLLIALNHVGTMYYVGTDQAGTPLVVSDATGTVIKTLEYNSFGQRLSDSNSAFELHIGYAGGLEDTATGLVRFGFRDYDQASGRWTARDPVLYIGGQANLYIYVGNNPINLRDPLGLWCIGGSFYSVFGAGVQVCRNNGQTSLCVEGGIGFGGSLDAGTGDVAKTGNNVKAEGGVSCGPIGAGVKCAYESRCGLDCDMEAGLDPFKFDTSGEVAVTKSLGGKKINPKCGYQAKLAYEGCGAW